MADQPSPQPQQLPVHDSDGNVVPNDAPNYSMWLQLDRAQRHWEEKLRRPSHNPDITSIRQHLLARQTVWNNVALEIQTGQLSPRAMHDIREALALRISTSNRGTIDREIEIRGPVLRRTIESQGQDYDAEIADMYDEADEMDAHKYGQGGTPD